MQQCHQKAFTHIVVLQHANICKNSSNMEGLTEVAFSIYTQKRSWRNTVCCLNDDFMRFLIQIEFVCCN